MAINPQHSYMTVEEYLQLDNESPDARYDYIDGQVIRCAGGSPQHADIAANVIGILKQLPSWSLLPCIYLRCKNTFVSITLCPS